MLWPSWVMHLKPVNPASARQRFEAIALPHLDAVYTAARRLTGNPDDAKDLVQDTILRAYRFFYQFTPGSNCRAWLLTILYNIIRNDLRRCARHPTSALTDDAAEQSDASLSLEFVPCSPEEIVARRGIGRHLEAAINALPEEFREAMLLVDVQELTYLEVAAVLSVPVGTVKSRVSRARSILRASLRETLHARGKTGT
jgi:RNA polymerase sigma-70 factor (ECF subfamily)